MTTEKNGYLYRLVLESCVLIKGISYFNVFVFSKINFKVTDTNRNKNTGDDPANLFIFVNAVNIFGQDEIVCTCNSKPLDLDSCTAEHSYGLIHK